VARPVNIGFGDQFKQSCKGSRRTTGCRPSSLFVSVAILQYLGRKAGQPSGEHSRVEVDQWLFRQFAGLGSLVGQAHHFL
jgi:GST-like protein